MTRVIIFDNEPIQAVADIHHPKHRTVIAFLQVIADRKNKAVSVSAIVPTTVRVEAGWDASDPRWAFANRLRIADSPLDRHNASIAASIRNRIGTHISVADAHVGAVIQSQATGDVTVLTSDPDDVGAIAGSLNINIVTV